MKFLVDSLEKNRSASYADLKAKADEKKLAVYPIMFGRAQALLGIVKSAKRGTGKFARATAAKQGRVATGYTKSDEIRELLTSGMSANEIAKRVGAKVGLVYNVKSRMGLTGKRGDVAGGRRPGRPRQVAASTSLDGLAGIVAAVQSGEKERSRMRAALERIQGVLADVLG